MSFPPIFSLPYITDYERLRIGGLIFAGLLVVGGLSVIVCKLFYRFNKYANIESW